MVDNNRFFFTIVLEHKTILSRAWDMKPAPDDKQNTELHDLRKITCLRKSEVSVGRVSVCNVIENLVGHSIHCLPCSYISDVINM